MSNFLGVGGHDRKNGVGREISVNETGALEVFSIDKQEERWRETTIPAGGRVEFARDLPHYISLGIRWDDATKFRIEIIPTITQKSANTGTTFFSIGEPIRVVDTRNNPKDRMATDAILHASRNIIRVHNDGNDSRTIKWFSLTQRKGG